MQFTFNSHSLYVTFKNPPPTFFWLFYLFHIQGICYATESYAIEFNATDCNMKFSS